LIHTLNLRTNLIFNTIFDHLVVAYFLGATLYACFYTERLSSSAAIRAENDAFVDTKQTLLLLKLILQFHKIQIESQIYM